MKKTLLFPVLVLVALVSACGPASEDREQMHKRAKVFQDSIANAIKVSMDEAAVPGPNVQRTPDPLPTQTAAATPTAPAK